MVPCRVGGGRARRGLIDNSDGIPRVGISEKTAFLGADATVEGARARVCLDHDEPCAWGRQS